MPQRKLQRLDNFSLSKDFERENLICRRFSVCQLNTLSAESSFRVIKHVLIYLINIRQNIAKRTLAHYVLNNSRTSIISKDFDKIHKKSVIFLGRGLGLSNSKSCGKNTNPSLSNAAAATLKLASPHIVQFT